MTTRCTHCGCYFSEQDFYSYCEPAVEQDLYHFAEYVADGLIADTRECAYCSSPVVLIKELREKSTPCQNLTK